MSAPISLTVVAAWWLLVTLTAFSVGWAARSVFRPRNRRLEQAKLITRA